MLNQISKGVDVPQQMKGIPFSFLICWLNPKDSAVMKLIRRGILIPPIRSTGHWELGWNGGTGFYGADALYISSTCSAKAFGMVELSSYAG